MLRIFAALVLVQSTPSVIVDPSVPTRKANVDSCTGGKACLDVKVVEGGGASSSGGGTIDGGDITVHGELIVYIADAGAPMNVNGPLAVILPDGGYPDVALLAALEVQRRHLESIVAELQEHTRRLKALRETGPGAPELGWSP